MDSENQHSLAFSGVLAGLRSHVCRRPASCYLCTLECGCLGMTPAERRAAVVASRWQDPAYQQSHLVFAGGRRPSAGAADCQPYSLFGMAKLVVGRETHQWVRKQIEWVEMDWYSDHTAFSGVHFCYHLTFHFAQWVTIRNKLQQTCAIPLELANTLTPKLPRDYATISTSWWTTLSRRKFEVLIYPLISFQSFFGP